jgi:hypothetical protein
MSNAQSHKEEGFSEDVVMENSGLSLKVAVF